MTTYLTFTTYNYNTPLDQSDQVTVPADVWEQMDKGHDGNGPIFVSLDGGGEGSVGRLRPAVPSDHLQADECRIPTWLWQHMGEPNPVDAWVPLTPIVVPDAGAITLRPRKEATLTTIGDPVTVLSAELSGSGGGMSWACVNVGAELPLSIGVFDVMDIRDTQGLPVSAACILDLDVTLELMSALDHVPTPPPARLIPPSGKGYTPFGGKGHRLGS
jgi:hypothetical protein